MNEKKLHLVGISKSGFWLAEQIIAILGDISDMEITLTEMKLNKRSPHSSAIEMTSPLEAFNNASVVLIDDVLNSGSVLMYGASHLLSQPLKRLTTAVLIDRNHKRFPIKADVKGLSLSTTMQEHVHVEIKGKSAHVFLS